MDGAGQAELLEGMAARPLEDHLVAMAAGGLVDDAADAEPVDGDESVDIPVIPEKRLDAAEIAELFLADGADDQEIADRRNAVLVDRLEQRQQRGKPAGVVADPRCVDDAV